MTSSDPKRGLLRHPLATLAHRGATTIHNAPEIGANFEDAGRTPGKILEPMDDLVEWALAMAHGTGKGSESQPLTWGKEAERFFVALRKLHDYGPSEEPLYCAMEMLLQGPIADARTHVGQWAMLPSRVGASVVGENCFVARVRAGRVGPEKDDRERIF